MTARPREVKNSDFGQGEAPLLVPVDRAERHEYLTIKLFNCSVHHKAMQDTLSLTLSALADPTRRAILARLAEGEASVTELAEPFEMSLPAVSKHLKVLEKAGLISRGREAQWRPCKLEAGPMKDVAGWLEHYRRFFEESFDRLDEYLQRLQKGETTDEGRDDEPDKS
jgi:DNA-binding transcriptional ArsR family regulator